MENIGTILLCGLKYIAIVCLVILALYLYFTFINFIESKTEKNKLEKYDVAGKQLMVTNDFFNLIDCLIENEIAKILSPFKLLGNRYQITAMDEDYEKISKAVYGAIKPSLIEQDGIAINQEYILQYIINRSQLLFFNSVIDFNQSIIQ